MAILKVARMGHPVLRERARPLEPDEVWLGLVPGVSLRCVTAFWPAFGHWKNSLAFKPRFLPREDGEVELAPNPARSLAHTVELGHVLANLLHEKSCPDDLRVPVALVAGRVGAGC